MIAIGIEYKEQQRIIKPVDSWLTRPIVSEMSGGEAVQKNRVMRSQERNNKLGEPKYDTLVDFIKYYLRSSKY